MKNKTFYKITLLVLATIIIEACCKKEKCPKFTQEQKNTMGYKGGEQLTFLVNDYVNKIKDTVVSTVNKTVEEGNIPCSHPTKAGECDILFRLMFLNDYYGKTNEIDKGLNFDPVFLLRNYENGKIVNNYAYNSTLQSVEINNKIYSNVIIDSIQKYDVYNYNSLSLFSENQVLYWNQQDGLILARMYVNDSLNIELINLK